MQFRPCIDIHNGKVKQIVGGSLQDVGGKAEENFVSEQDAAFYARLYRDKGLRGGHIILLNPAGSEYYNDDLKQAFSAMSEFPNGLQIGGGITAENAAVFLEKGASHVIVTSYVFKDGQINMDNLVKISRETGKEHLCIDLSCRKKDGKFYIVTDRWQKFTDTVLSPDVMRELSAYCDEFLVHAVDVEGCAVGIQTEVAEMLGNCPDLTVTYAGGISSVADLQLLKQLGRGNVNFTIGTALDLFGGNISFEAAADFR